MYLKIQQVPENLFLFNNMREFAFTCGDINGIGPEIVIKTLNKLSPTQLSKTIFICPQNVFNETLKIVPVKFDFYFAKEISDKENFQKLLVFIINNSKISFGRATKSSGKTSYQSIITACEFAKANKIKSIITSPISKFAFQKAGIDYPGHTELLADFFSVNNFVMMFLSKKMKAGLTTIHLPIKDVAKNITKSKIENTIEVVLKSLQIDFKIKNPKIALLGLNPHAGENGKIGKEELEIFIPIIKERKNYLEGPFVPDAYFGNHLYKNFDCTIGLYHDQVLIPFKLMNFNKGVNFTAGLPIVRTSPDHGTAFDIAGKGIANEGSMYEAFRYAEKIAKSK